MDLTDLAAKIASAEHERAIWQAGRRAFCVGGATAVNPYSAHSPNYALWADGFDAGRQIKRLPYWVDGSGRGKPVGERRMEGGA